MARWLAVFFFGGLVGAGFGGALGIFLFPFFFPPAPLVETLTPSERVGKVAEGAFLHVDKNDPLHYGQGKVSVYRRTVFLHDGFKVGPGPKYHVYLVPKAPIRSSDDLKGDANLMYVDLGRLRSFEGDQKYHVPGGVDLTRMKSVVIWCETFAVLISPADLAPVKSP